MKKVRKGECPPSLSAYAAEHPQATWKEMRGRGRESVYYDIKERLLRDQRHLCAYCEGAIGQADNFQVEHFHPKSVDADGRNRHLDWNNLLGVCNGGATPPDQADSEGTSQRRRGRSHLSCGARKRDKNSDLFLNPLRMPPFPAAYRINRLLGSLEPNEDFCREHPDLHEGRAASTRALLESTVNELNLNCERLRGERMAVIEFFDEQERAAREGGQKPGDILPKLARRFFGEPMQPYFTTARFCLGQAAENYLQSINFDG